MNNEARAYDIKQKQKQKLYKDRKPYVKPHNISEGDTVLLRQRKTKFKPPYDPRSYIVTQIRGHQITAERDEKIITRDAQQWKKFSLRRKPDYDLLRTLEDTPGLPSDDDTGFTEMETETEQEAPQEQKGTPEEQQAQQQQPLRRNPRRTRNPIERFGYDNDWFK